MENLKVEGHSSLRKNIKTGAVTNNDRTAFERYMQSKKQYEKMQSSIEDINTLKEEISEIKSLLREILKKNG